VRLVVYEDQGVERLHPLSLTRSAAELRCGMVTLAQRISRCFEMPVSGHFVRDYLAGTVRIRAGVPVNDRRVLLDDEVLLVNARLLPLGCSISLPESDTAIVVPAPALGTGHPAVDSQIAVARLSSDTTSAVDGDIDLLINDVIPSLPSTNRDLTLVDYPWNLVHHNPEALVEDFAFLDRHGVDGEIHMQAAVIGDPANLWVAPGAVVHPFVAIDVTGGPVVIDEGAEIHPHTRIEGPGYIGSGTIVVGGKIREGCSIGPVCRVGGEVEESIIHGYSNKYHDGFLGHAYVGEWVNLGAQTTNSDLKNDYTSVKLEYPSGPIDSGDTKVGCFIGDYTKTSIGTLFNTGTIVGCMVNCLNHGGLMPKYIPSCALVHKGAITRGQRFVEILDTARVAMSRRKRVFTDADTAMLTHVRGLTRPELLELSMRDRTLLLA
jgi:UDP-N-acetylglucosamine diphosphorylase / glucose-1-phosphate thymidylyltransferase / UDP-N-acetylgalactosamine diphosphorylase / glucosamine-1-phosphate N-acetyltransferase / galactosamine-1-phosphate N-acetyltransferase